jgi:hypothetical protein
MKIFEILTEVNQTPSGNLNWLDKYAKIFNMGFEVEFLGSKIDYLEKKDEEIKLRDDLQVLLGETVMREDDEESFVRGHYDKKYSTFTITSDPSVKKASGNNSHYYGYELVSPAYGLKDNLKHLYKVLKYIDKSSEFYTNGTAGLHINLSFKDPSITKKIDTLKLVLFLGEGYLKKQFARDDIKGNNGQKIDYINLILPELSEHLRSNVKWNKDLDGLSGNERMMEIFKIAKKLMKVKNYKDRTESHYKTGPEYSHSKSFTVALTKLENYGYLEFRVMGGEDYEKRVDEIMANIGRFCKLLSIASDENLYKEEYFKKFTKLVAGALPYKESEDDREYYSKYDLPNTEAFEIPIKNILAQYHQDQDYQTMSYLGCLKFKNYQGAIYNLLDIFSNGGAIVKNASYRKWIYQMGKHFGLSRKDVLDYWTIGMKQIDDDENYDEDKHHYNDKIFDVSVQEFLKWIPFN